VIAFALVTLAWAVGQTGGAAGSARLAEAAGTDKVPYLLLSATCLVTLAVLARARRVPREEAVRLGAR
jgi:hypothetical protein